MKFKGMRYFCLVVGCLALLTPSCTCADVSTNPTEFIPSPELVEFVADKVAAAQRDSDVPGMVIAYVAGFSDPEFTGEPKSVIRVWRYEGGLVDVDEEVFLEALYGSEWPSRTIAFALKSLGPNQVEAYVHTWYDMGISEGSRGGNAQKWTLEKQEEEWVVLDKDPYMFWD